MLTLAMPTEATEPESVAEAALLAARSGADLLLLPLHGERAAEPCDGPLADRMGERAGEARIAILFTYAEACSGNTHLALQLVQADGRATANCRAAHLSKAALQAGWRPGDWLTIALLGGLRVGLMGGLDPLAPEVGRALSALGAELLVGALVGSPACPEEALQALATVRALENGAAVCLFGGPGSCAVANADGRPAERAMQAGLSLFRVHAGERHGTVARRPELYRRLQMAADTVVE
jgi:predicted amidohydrolase